MIDLWQLDSRFGIITIPRNILGGESNYELLKRPRYIDKAKLALDDDEAQIYVDGVTFSADQGGNFFFNTAPGQQVGATMYFRSGHPVSVGLFLPIGKGKPLLYSVECLGNFSLNVLCHVVRYSSRQPTNL